MTRFSTYQGAETPAPLHVLHVLKDLPRHAGTSQETVSIVRHTNRERTIYSFLFFNDCPDSMSADLRAMGCAVTSVRRPSKLDVRLARDIARVAQRDGADVLCTHFARADIVGALVGRSLGIPVVKFVHGMRGNDSRAIQLMDGALDSWRAVTVCVSDAARRARVAQGSKGPHIVILDGVPDEAVRLIDSERDRIRSSLGAGRRDFLVCHVGSLIALRRQELLVDAVGVMHRAGVEVRLIIAGEGPQRPILESRIEAAGLVGTVSLLGERPDVRDLMAASDAYVNMADEEGFGIAVVEAMQARLPVVLANAGALPELVCDGQNGVLVPAGDAGALASALNALIADPASARRLGESARVRALSHFSIERHVADLENVFAAACVTPDGG
jgi:glycosyltransferase involved in cell wall biosynthesis